VRYPGAIIFSMSPRRPFGASDKTPLTVSGLLVIDVLLGVLNRARNEMPIGRRGKIRSPCMEQITMFKLAKRMESSLLCPSYPAAAIKVTRLIGFELLFLRRIAEYLYWIFSFDCPYFAACITAAESASE